MNGVYLTDVPNFELKRGKVRDVYSLGETMLIVVTTDRISAFDYVFPDTIIPDKGRILQAFSCFWVDVLNLKYHSISTNLNRLPEEFRKPEFEGRTMLVEKADVIPFECIVKGYLCGSAWHEYKKTGMVCGISLPSGLKENQYLNKPIFTPSTKAKNGHDEYVTFDYVVSKIGLDLAVSIESLSLQIYSQAADLAWQNGIIIADTKLEFGVLEHSNNAVVLIDEVLTPDNSRFWPLEAYNLDCQIESFDKQYVRDWFAGLDKNLLTMPTLPEEVIMKTRQKYFDAYERITGRTL
jgi:phosphoribosylaminoimidazole-succinocarboxamide synthase